MLHTKEAPQHRTPTCQHKLAGQKRQHDTFNVLKNQILPNENTLPSKAAQDLKRKHFPDKQSLKESTTTKIALPELLKELLRTEIKGH